MAASGFTPISLYYSTTASAVPTSGNLANGELGLNIADMKLYAKNSAGTVTLLASNAGASGSVTSVSGTGTVNGLTLTGTVTTSGSLTLGGTLSLVSPPPIGSTTPNTGAFTTLSATKGSAGLVAFFLSGNSAQSPYVSLGRAAEDVRIQIAAATNDLFTGTVAGDYATNSNGSIWFGTGGNPITKISSTGLAVTGTLSATGSTLFGRSARISATSASMELNGNGIALTNDKNGSNNNWSLIQNTATTSGSNIAFTSGTGSMIFDNAGNLVIGTTTALSSSAGRTDLTVNGSSTAIVSLGIGGARQGYLYAPTGGIILASETGALNVTTTTAQPIYLATNNTTRFFIGTSGQFGIGATPSYGTSGQVLTSGGSGAAPTWASAAAGGTTMLFAAFSATGGR